MKKKTVNVLDIYNLEVEHHVAGGFVLEFTAQSHKIRLHLDGWWTTPIAHCLWKVIGRAKAQITEQEAAMKEAG
jgi:hypothetical protein